jgi:hypothetical protein
VGGIEVVAEPFRTVHYQTMIKPDHNEVVFDTDEKDHA